LTSKGGILVGIQEDTNNSKRAITITEANFLIIFTTTVIYLMSTRGRRDTNSP